MYKIGTRVRHNPNGYYAGRKNLTTGVVVQKEANLEQQMWVSVVWDDLKDGHNLGGSITGMRGWNVPAKDLIPIETEVDNEYEELLI